jgi:hypothetical protein
MSRPVCLSLFDYSGEWARPWLETHDVIIMDARHPDGWTFGEDRIRRYGGPARHWGPELVFYGMLWRADCILAAPPCTHFSKAGARLWPEKDADGRTAEHLELIDFVLHLIEEASPRVWALENPPGRLANMKGAGLRQEALGLPRYSFDPCDHGDPWRKRTHLWGRFAIPERHPVEPITYDNGTPNNRNHVARLSSKDERRRMTPAGFARDFYEANKQ